MDYMNYHNLALKGGGIRGYAYIGALRELAKLGLLERIRAISGSSAGAITSLFACSGLPINELEKRLSNIDFKALIYDEWSVLEEPIDWLEDFGLHEGKSLYALFQEAIKNITGNENTNFIEWHNYKEKHKEKNLKDIYVEACNISRGYNEIFAYGSTEKNAKTPVALAIAASMAFPQFFTPKLINDDLYSDGGIQANCPMHVFENPKGQPNPHTLGIWLDNHDNLELFNKGLIPPKKPINHSWQCLEAQIDAVMNVQNFDLFNSRYKNQMIYCDTLGIGTLNFGLTADEKKALDASGEYGVIRFACQYFPEIAKKHYPQILITALQKQDFPVSIGTFLKKMPLEKNNTPYITQWQQLALFNSTATPTPFTPQFKQVSIKVPKNTTPNIVVDKPKEEAASGCAIF